MIKVDVSGFEEFEKYLNRMADGFETFLRKFLLKEALRVLRDTKRNTPVDSGYLRNNWQVGDSRYAFRYTTSRKSYKANRTLSRGKFRVVSVKGREPTINSVRKSGDSLIVEIYNPVEYASYVEYGHVSQGRVKRWIPGRLMCVMAIENVERKMPRHFNMEFKRWLKNLERG